MRPVCPLCPVTPVLPEAPTESTNIVSRCLRCIRCTRSYRICKIGCAVRASSCYARRKLRYEISCMKREAHDASMKHSRQWRIHASLKDCEVRSPHDIKYIIILSTDEHIVRSYKAPYHFSTIRAEGDLPVVPPRPDCPVSPLAPVVPEAPARESTRLQSLHKGNALPL